MILIVSSRLSEAELSVCCKKITTKAKERHGRYEDLMDSVITKKLKSNFAKQTIAEMEADNIKAIVAFELKSNKKNRNGVLGTKGSAD